MVDRLREKAVNVLLPGNVGVDAEHLAARGPHFLGGQADGIGLQGGDDDLGLGGGKGLGDHSPQPAGTAGNQNNLMLPEGHGSAYSVQGTASTTTIQ